MSNLLRALLGISFLLSAPFANARDERPFPEPGSKKGLQVQMLDDGIALGIRHATLNVSIEALIDFEARPENPVWEIDGKKISIRKSNVDSLGVKTLSDAGVNVYLILLGIESGKPERDGQLLHPSRAAKTPNRISAINTVTEDGARLWRGVVEYLADRFSRPNDEFGRVAGYIVGNEVNVHHEWHNFGKMPREKAVADYLRQLRIAHEAVRKASANARVYVPLTHHWTLEPGPTADDSMGSKTFLELLNRQAKAGGDFDWYVAYHPYPEDLGNPRTWEDRTATPSLDAPRITFRNLEQLPAFLAKPEMLWDGKPRRVILSEQGFHSTGAKDPKRGEQVQAAAYCYAWEKVARLPGVDAFILHRHVDHGQEGGLNLGLWSRKPDSVATPAGKKPIYQCFKAAGTPRQAEAFAFALPIVGIKSWDELGALRN